MEGAGGAMGLIKRMGTTQNLDLSKLSEGEQTQDLDQLSEELAKRAGIETLPRGTLLQGRYEIEQVLGVGGMSVVYRARDLHFKDVIRLCAIKEMFHSSPDSKTRQLKLKNFQREASLLATLSHPSIPKVYDYFTEGGRVYLVLEFVEGQDLESLLDSMTAPMHPEQALAIALQVCDVLEYLHSHKPEPIIFRDLKPSNIMLTPEDRVVLIDFGIARTLMDEKRGTMIGTEGYAPPEQYRGIATPRGDIYALAATLHHLLTKEDPRMHPPFSFEERPIRKYNPAVPPELEAAIQQALAYDPEDRYPTVRAFREALLAAVGEEVGTQGPTVVGRRTRTRVQTELLWKFQCEDEVRSSPFADQGVVVVGSYDRNIYALDAEQGRFLWKFATGAGVSSSPRVHEGMVVVGSEDHKVYCLDLGKGTVLWEAVTGGPVRSSPAILKDLVFVGSDDQHLYALDLKSGRVFWKGRTWGTVRSSPAVSDELVVVGAGDGYVYAYDAFSGSLRWKFRTSRPVISSPAIVEGVVYVGSADTFFYALDLRSGKPLWRFRAGDMILSSPAVADGTVYVGSVDGYLYALRARNGRLLWRFQVGGQVNSSPRVANGRVYFGAATGFVYCLEAEKGELLWHYPTEGPIVSSPAVVEDRVFIGSNDHHLYALRA